MARKQLPEIALARQDQLVERALERRPDMRAARVRIAQAQENAYFGAAAGHSRRDHKRFL